MLSKQDKKDIAEISAQTVIGILSAKKQDTPVKTGKQPKRQEKNASPPHKKSDIPALLNAMNRKESIELFGDITQNPPYKHAISKFYDKYNIQLDVAKFERKTLTYEQKHLIIVKQLQGATKKVFDAQKKRHLKDLREKIANPPVTNIFGKEMSDKNLESREANLQKEVSRWESEQYKE